MGPNPHQKNGIVRKFWKKGLVPFCPIPQNQKEMIYSLKWFKMQNKHEYLFLVLRVPTGGVGSC